MNPTGRCAAADAVTNARRGRRRGGICARQITGTSEGACGGAAGPVVADEGVDANAYGVLAGATVNRITAPIPTTPTTTTRPPTTHHLQAPGHHRVPAAPHRPPATPNTHSGLAPAPLQRPIGGTDGGAAAATTNTTVAVAARGGDARVHVTSSDIHAMRPPRPTLRPVHHPPHSVQRGGSDKANRACKSAAQPRVGDAARPEYERGREARRRGPRDGC